MIASSRAKYAMPRAEVEAMLLAKLTAEGRPIKAEPQPPPKIAKSIPSARKVATDSAPEEATTVSQDSIAHQGGVEPPADAPKPVVEQRRPTKVSEQGKGGHQHKLLQERIKVAAEARGFRADLEMEVGDSRETVDVGLIRRDIRIACEISSTTTIDHEVGNMRKCLAAGFGHVAVIAGRGRRLQQMAEAMKACFSGDDFSRLGFYEPDQFLAFIEGLPVPSPPLVKPSDADPNRRGYKLKRTYTTLCPQEKAQREEQALREITEELRKPLPASGNA